MPAFGATHERRERSHTSAQGAGGRIKTVKENPSSTKVDSLGERLRVVEIRAELARVEAERLLPLTKLASERAGRPVSEDEMRDRARRRRDEILSRIQQAPE